MIPVSALLLFVALVAAVHVSTTTLEYSRHNIQWNGTSHFVDRLDAEGAMPIRDYAHLSGHTGSLLLIIAPSGNLTEEDASMLDRYLQDGNLILIADDTGNGNQILTRLGSGIVIHPCNLSSLDRGYRDPAALIGTCSRHHPLLTNVTSVQFNHPSAVEGGVPLVNTSRLTWIDANGNQRPDAGEPMGAFTIAASEQRGGGELVVLGDPRIFTNSMSGLRSESDNDQLLQNILELYPVILYDEAQSRTADAGAMIEMVRWLKTTPLRDLLAAAVIVMVLVIFRRLR